MDHKMGCPTRRSCVWGFSDGLRKLGLRSDSLFLRFKADVGSSHSYIGGKLPAPLLNKLFTLFANSAKSPVFPMTSSIPTAVTSKFPNAASCDVSKTIGASGNIFFNRGAASIPFIRGIDKSSTIKSGFCSRAFSIASIPSTASQHSYPSAPDSKIERMTFRTCSKSSTISTHFPKAIHPSAASLRSGRYNGLQCAGTPPRLHIR